VLIAISGPFADVAKQKISFARAELLTLLTMCFPAALIPIEPNFGSAG